MIIFIIFYNFDWQMESHFNDVMADIVAIVVDGITTFVKWLMLLPLWQME